MDISSVYKALNVFASMCLMLSSCGLPTTLSFPTTSDPLYSLSDESFSVLEDNEILLNHVQLAEHVSSLQSLFSGVLHDYKASRFGNPETSCRRNFVIMGMPPHHRLSLVDLLQQRESDLLTTHHSFVARYMEVMDRVIVDEYLYEGKGSFLHDRDESFLTIKNFLGRIQVLLNQQLAIEELDNSGIVLYSVEDLNFPPEDNEAMRNIRVLCALEDIHLYLPMLHQHVTFLRNIEH